jgi:hypothetical protein
MDDHDHRYIITSLVDRPRRQVLTQFPLLRWRVDESRR